MALNARDAVTNAIRDSFNRFRGEISDETTAEDVPGWDSLRHVKLMFEIEKRLGVEIDIAETYEFENVGALIAYLQDQE